MRLIDLFDVTDAFHPKLYYFGDWYLTRDTFTHADHFMLNAKVEDGKNKYEEFLEKNYYIPMINFLRAENIARDMQPRIIITDRYNDGGKGLYFSYVHMFLSSLTGCNPSNYMEAVSQLEDETTIEDMTAVLRDSFREERKILSEIERHGKQSPDYDRLYGEYRSFLTGEISATFNDYLGWKKEGLTNAIFALKQYPEFFRKELNVNSLLSCFDYDKFCLCTAHSILTSCYDQEQRSGLAENTACYLYQYIEAVENLRKFHPTYSCSIVDAEKNGKKKIITFDEISITFKRFLAAHPEFKIFKFTHEEAQRMVKSLVGKEDVDLSMRGAETLLDQALTILKEARELGASWEFLRKGQIEDDESTFTGLEGGLRIPYPELSEDEKIRRMLIGKHYLDNSDFLYSLKGINEFAGYIGYIYANGNVIFEKFYEDDECLKVASENATYVMNLYRFVELSKLKKAEIIRKIKHEGTKEVKRIYHGADMEKWKSRVNQTISGTEYNEEVLSYINMLLDQQVLNKVKRG